MRWFPVKDKRPLISGWQVAATSDQEVLAAWSEQWQCDFGVPTGAAEGMFVLDVDVKNNGFHSLKALEDAHGALPATYTVSTKNGGIHYYFVYPTNMTVRQTQGLRPGIDVRSDGGYVVADGSDGYKSNGGDINAAPQWLLELISAPLVNAAGAPAGVGAVSSSRGLKTPLNKRTLSFIAFGADDGQWHQELVQAAFDMKANSFTEEEARALLAKATGELDAGHDLVQIADVFNNREPLYPVEAPATLVVPWTAYVDDYVDYVDNPGRMEGVATGLPSLDVLLGGGVRPGEVMGLLAQAKVGKSSFSHKIMHSWLKEGHAVGYASREMKPSTEVLPNLLSIELGRNALKVPATRDDLNNVKWNLSFAEGMGHMPLEDIECWLRDSVALGTKLFVFDHLHHFVADEDYQTLAKFSRAIKALVMELNVGCILVIQPRQLSMDERPSFRSIRGGAAIGQAVDSLVVLERDKTNRNITKVTLDIARHKLASPGEIFLCYDKEKMDFTEVVQEELVPEEQEEHRPETKYGVVKKLEVKYDH